MGIFDFFAYGVRNKGVSASLLRHNQKNQSVIKGQIWKLRGQSLALRKFLASLLDSKFDVDYDFAIKHVPI